jgi:polar amino acid transport system permease protein
VEVEKQIGGAGETRPPGVPPDGLTRWQRVEMASMRVPFRVKLALVWLGVFTVLGILFALVGFDVAWMGDHVEFIALGLPFTLIISVAAIILALILATLGALARLSRNPVAFGVSGFYVSFFRGTPLIVQIFLINFGLAQIGSNLRADGHTWGELLIFPPILSGVLALGLNYGAYMTEIFRAGIQSVAHGQAEAAQALGMTYAQMMRRVILPQAVRVIIPPTGNEFIAMLKDSALVSFIGVAVAQMEVFRRAQLLGTRDFRPFEALVLAAVMYWALTTVFTFFQQRLERRLSRGYVRAGSFQLAGGGHGGHAG